MLKEIHHRVKNNMQVISSLLSLQSRFFENYREKQMFREMRDRIKSMSLIHEKLYQDGNFGHLDFAHYLRILTAEVFRSYRVSPSLIKLKSKVDPVVLEIDKAIPCGLIVHELLSNALKYAFPEGRKGEIRLECRAIPKGKMTLMVADNGVGFPKDMDFERTDSLGLELVHTLTHQLDGKLTPIRERGAGFRIIFSV